MKGELVKQVLILFHTFNGINFGSIVLQEVQNYTPGRGKIVPRNVI